MTKVLIVFGTRPEAIKMCPLVLEMKKNPNFQVYVCVSGQHVELLNDVCNIFDVVPDIRISSMEPGQSLSVLFSKIITQLDGHVKEIAPDLMLVHGDTLTTVASALCAFYNKVKLGHVEAGLRTFDLDFPWPEEGNRKLVSAISAFNFVPTQKSYENLVSEGVKKESIFITGNTVIDALLFARNKVQELDNLNLNVPAIHKTETTRSTILVTCHRRENHGKGVRNLCEAILDLINIHKKVQFVISMHPNPAVKDVFLEHLSNLKQVTLIGSQDYLSFVHLMDNADLILSDSGGIQEEAPSLGVPVFVLRNVSERPEAVEAGTVTLIGNERENIVRMVSEFLDNGEHARLTLKGNPYGDGTACIQIREILEEHFK